MAFRYKRIETRSWETEHRGDLVIHAAKKKDATGRVLWECEQHTQAIPMCYGKFDALPFGCLVCVVNLVDVVPTEWLLHSDENTASAYRAEYLAPARGSEERYGNYTSGRFAWITKDSQMFTQVFTPIPYVGQRGMFGVTL